MMQCPKCKDFVDDERNAFCPNCGTPLAAPEPVPQPVPQEEQPAPETPETAQPPVQEPPVQQPAPPVYQFVQPGQPFPQPPQGVQQIVYVCQPAPRPKNGGAITGFVFGIAQIVVTPPCTAALPPVSSVSLYSSPGSLRCTCRSINPGNT